VCGDYLESAQKKSGEKRKRRKVEIIYTKRGANLVATKARKTKVKTARKKTNVIKRTKVLIFWQCVARQKIPYFARRLAMCF